MKSREWVDRAKCHDSPDYQQWWTENLPKSTSNLHWLKAKSLCADCPVFTQCAEEAVELEDAGVVRAGVPLLASADQNHKKGRYKEIQQRAGITPRDETDPLDTSQLPGRADPQPFKYQGHDFVSHAGASQILCISPRQIDWLRQHGRLGISEIKIRRIRNHKGNPATIYFPVHELVWLADKREQEREENDAARRAAGKPPQPGRNQFGQFQSALALRNGLGTAKPGQA